MKTLKTIKTMTVFAALGVTLAAVGCDSGSSCADGGVCDGGLGGKSGAGGAGGAGGAPALYGLTGGTYCFDVTGITGLVDGCGITPNVITKLPVTYTAATGAVAVGREGSVGQGAVANNMGTLSRVGNSSDGPACMWSQTDTSTLTMTANNAFTISVSETESGFSATCVPAPVSDPCTSTWTWTMQIHVPATMPNALGNCE